MIVIEKEVIIFELLYKYDVICSIKFFLIKLLGFFFCIFAVDRFCLDVYFKGREVNLCLIYLSVYILIEKYIYIRLQSKSKFILDSINRLCLKVYFKDFEINLFLIILIGTY